MSYISFQPSDYFNTVLYTGNGSTNAITGVGFQPDWVWIKRRDGTNTHNLFDAVRGATKALESNETLAEQTLSTALTAFDSDGFTLGSGGDVNGSSASQVSWNWKANGQGSSNTDGSINTTYTSASTTSGFSISTYVGTGSAATIGHGLGVKPSVVLVKNISSAEHWVMYHHKSHATPEDNYIRLNESGAVSDFDMWNDTAPTSSLFSISSNGSVGASGDTYVAYCFAEKKGFSAMGSYVGTGTTSGAFLYTGFSPAWFLVKKSSVAGEYWGMYDSKRNTFNPVDLAVVADRNDAESDFGDGIDFCSNGIKIRDSGGELNASGATYIYMAFAESPIVSSNGVPATAR